MRAPLVAAGTDAETGQCSPIRSRARRRVAVRTIHELDTNFHVIADACVPDGRARHRRSPASTPTRANATDGVGHRPSSSQQGTTVRDLRSQGVLPHQSEPACAPSGTDAVRPDRRSRIRYRAVDRMAAMRWRSSRGAPRRTVFFKCTTLSRTPATRSHAEESWQHQASRPSARAPGRRIAPSSSRRHPYVVSRG